MWKNRLVDSRHHVGNRLQNTTWLHNVDRRQNVDILQTGGQTDSLTDAAQNENDPDHVIEIGDHVSENMSHPRLGDARDHVIEGQGHVKKEDIGDRKILYKHCPIKISDLENSTSVENLTS